MGEVMRGVGGEVVYMDLSRQSKVLNQNPIAIFRSHESLGFTRDYVKQTSNCLGLQ
jgi:hypothetical protein